jgi:hypothetical protein
VTAVAAYECGHALHDQVLCERLLEDVEVDVGMRIYKPGRDDQAIGVDGMSGCSGEVPNSGDFFPADPDAPTEPGLAGAIDDGSVSDEKIKVCGHFFHLELESVDSKFWQTGSSLRIGTAHSLDSGNKGFDSRPFLKKEINPHAGCPKAVFWLSIYGEHDDPFGETASFDLFAGLEAVKPGQAQVH